MRSLSGWAPAQGDPWSAVTIGWYSRHGDFLFSLRQDHILIFPLNMQIVISMYYFTSLEVSWLVQVADWEWPLRKSINYLLNDVSWWSHVMNPCLPFLRFTDHICYSILMCIWSIKSIGLGRFIEKSNDLITNELSLADNMWWARWSTALLSNVVSRWLDSPTGWPLVCCYLRLTQQTFLLLVFIKLRYW